jgi:excisionase family DNA binding protein
MQYYTLEEAARLLGISTDELKKMAERNELRPFRDRGSMRFRSQEIDELARRRGQGSDADLPLADSPRAGPADSPARVAGEGEEGGTFDFTLNVEESDQVEIGQELPPPGGSGRGGRSGSSKSKLSGPKSPPPKPGSDSDVRLVPDGSDLDFQVASDSDVKLSDSPAPAASSARKLPGAKPKSVLKPPSTRRDSSVKMVPLDDGPGLPGDSSDEARMPGSGPVKAPSDSDVRLDPAGKGSSSRLKGPKKDDHLLTEEIDLDAELARAKEQERARGEGKKSRLPKPAQPQLPTTSPFELSEADLDVPLQEPAAEGLEDSSSDFDLTPASLQEDQSPVELGSDEMPMPAGDDEVSLGELTASGGESGINLQDPVDSGISLEQGSSEEIEFELSLDAGRTPKPKSGKSSAPESVEDSDSEFELTLDDSSGDMPAAEEEEGLAPESSSEFELSIDDSGSDSGLEPAGGSSPVDSDSDSEFELTLDESGNLPAVEEESGGEDEKDIFETDFEVPALDDESGSQAVALDESDTDLESSDFDLALDDEDASSDEESGSQVVALEEDSDVDEGAETIARPRRQRGAPLLEEQEAEDLLEEDMDFGDIGTGAEAEEEEEEAAPRAAVGAAVAPAKPAEWGALPTLVMLPCVIVMFLVGLMGYELIHTMWGYHQPTPVSSTLLKPLAEMFGSKLPDE